MIFLGEDQDLILIMPVLQAFSRVKKFGCVCKKLQGLQPLTRRYTPIPGTTAQDPVTVG